MDDQALADALPEQLVDLWGMDPSRVEPLGGGMNSSTALVEVGSQRFVAKWSRDVVSLESGCSAAAMLGEHGVITGEARRSSSGDLTVSLANGRLALLHHVAGRELSGEDAHEQVLMAATFARAHWSGGPAEATGPFMDEWLSPPSPVLAVSAWLPAAFTGVRAHLARRLPSTSLGHSGQLLRESDPGGRPDRDRGRPRAQQGRHRDRQASSGGVRAHTCPVGWKA